MKPSHVIWFSHAAYCMRCTKRLEPKDGDELRVVAAQLSTFAQDHEGCKPRMGIVGIQRDEDGSPNSVYIGTTTP